MPFRTASLLTWWIVCCWTAFFALICGDGRTCAAEATDYVDAVWTHYTNVLQYGRDQYGQPSPLFADGIDIEDEQAIVSGNGVVICNFAFQQYLLRGLAGLSNYRGIPNYCGAAVKITAYVLENLVNEKSGRIRTGLLHVSTRDIEKVLCLQPDNSEG